MQNATIRDEKQEELNALAVIIHYELNHFTKALDLVGGAMISNTIAHSYRVKDAIIAFMMTYRKYRDTHRNVIWEGEEVRCPLVTQIVMDVLNKIEELSDFKIVNTNS